jgi:hypothetical protein
MGEKNKEERINVSDLYKGVLGNWSNATSYPIKDYSEIYNYKKADSIDYLDKAPDIIETVINLIRSHSKIPKVILEPIRKNDDFKCIFMSLAKKYYSAAEMEAFLKDNKEFLDEI